MRFFFLTIMLSGCSSAPLVPGRPAWSVLEAESGYGRVYFSREEESADAIRCAAEIDRSFLQTAERLGIRSEAPLEVWLDYSLESPGVLEGGHITFNPSGEWIEMVELVMAHELLHWHAMGTAIALNLPHFVQEGVCELLSSELVPEQGRVRTESLLAHLRRHAEQGTLGQLVARFCMDPAQAEAERPDETLEISALGFRLVEQIGYEALREAALAGPVTPERVLEMAGVDAQGGGLRIPAPSAQAAPLVIARYFDADGVLLLSVPFESSGSAELPPGTVRMQIGE